MYRAGKFGIHFVLLAAAALGSWSCCVHAMHYTRGDSSDCDGTPRHHFIFVFDDGGVTEECADVSKKKNHQIIWMSTNDKPLKIEFQLMAGQKQPFQNMECVGSVCRVRDCGNARCASGPINPELTPSRDGLYYDYSVSVGFKTKGDPGLRIDP